MTADDGETEKREEPAASASAQDGGKNRDDKSPKKSDGSGDKKEDGRSDGDKSDEDSKDKSDKDGDDKTGDEEDGDDEAEKKPSPLKKPWVRILLIVVAILVVLAAIAYGWYYWTTGQYFQSTDDAYIKAEQVQISAQVSGDIAELLVAENQVVNAGDTLLRIGDSGFRAKVEESLAQVAQERANEAEAQAELQKQPAVIAEAQAQVQMAEASLSYAQGEVDRYKPLAASGAETKEKYAQLVSERDQDAAQLASYQAQLEAQKLTTPSLEAKVGQARAAVKQAEAQVQDAQVSLDDAVIKAPISGRVGDLTARIGQYAQAGMQLMTIVPVQEIYLEANFKETQIGLMRVGQAVSISVDALPQETLRGKVESFSPGTGSQFSLIPPQNATGNFTKVVQRVPVRISIDAGPEARKVLVPGLSVVAEVDTRNAKNFVKDAKEEEKRDDKLEEQEKTETEKDRSAP